MTRTVTIIKAEPGYRLRGSWNRKPSVGLSLAIARQSNF